MELSEDIIADYLVECHEGLDRLDRDLVSLEQGGDERGALDCIFRTLHTIKGGAGFLGYNRLESLTHAGEDVLSRLRDGELELNMEIASALLTLVDFVRRTLASIEESRSEGTEDITEVLEVMHGFLHAGETEVIPAVDLDGLQADSEVEAREEPSPAAVPGPAEVSATRPGAVPEQKAEADGTPHPPAEGRAPSLADSTIRVDVHILDRLMNLVGELVLTRNQILQHSARSLDTTFVATSQRLNLITTELQEGVMKTRMQPIGNIFSKFPRVVRDLAVALHKQVRIEMEGQETELDKTLIEAIKDPLTHIVRNSVSHGLEEPDLRLARGKPVEGRLLLRAYHEGGQVNIEICDDGGGIDPVRVRQKALERGLISPDQAARLSESELINLIFLPGFSTAPSVTNISGRGVGMDVVKTNIEKIGGTIDIQNAVGVGLTLRIKIPLTLAIIPALIVTSGGDRYAIPQVNLLELVRVDASHVQSAVEKIDGTPVYRLRGFLLPLVYLNGELRVGDPGSNPAEETHSIVVLQADECRFGLVVDTINDTEEIVVKPLSKQIKNIPAFAGATIMGDGKVALILDVHGLAQRARVLTEKQPLALAASRATSSADEAEIQRLLLCRVGHERRLAIPLAHVSRLEEFHHPVLERAGDLEAVQYRGRILRLVRLARELGEPCEADARPSKLSVVVFAEGEETLGLVVEEIVDIVEERLAITPCGARDGILGAAIIGQRVTDVLDIHRIIAPFRAAFTAL